MYNAKISLLASTGGIVSAGIFSLVIASFLVESAFLQAVLWVMCMVLFIVASSLYIQAYKLIGKQEEIEIERREEEKLRHNVLKKSLEQFIKLPMIESKEAFETPTVKPTQSIGTSSIESGEEFGDSKVSKDENETNTNQD